MTLDYINNINALCPGSKICVNFVMLCAKIISTTLTSACEKGIDSKQVIDYMQRESIVAAFMSKSCHVIYMDCEFDKRLRKKAWT